MVRAWLRPRQTQGHATRRAQGSMPARKGRHDRQPIRRSATHDAFDHGIRGSRSSSLSPRQPPCWQQGEPPLFKVWAQMPGTGGRSPGSRVVVSDEHRRIFLTFPKVDAARKGGRFVDDRGVRPRLIAQPFSGFSGWFALQAVRTTRTATRHVFPPDGRPSPLYSRGVGCDWRSRSGSPPSHSLLLPGPQVLGPETIRLTGIGASPAQVNRAGGLTASARCSSCP